jgi:hypothetical protein
VWNVWKERCRRVFDNRGLTAAQLQVIIRQDVEQWNATMRSQAWGTTDPGEPKQADTGSGPGSAT